MAKFKSIIRGAFRDLKPGECRVFLMRHGAHQDGILTPVGIKLLQEEGAALKAAGITTIAACISSPADRALASVLYLKASMGIAGRTTTLKELGDLSSENKELVQQLKDAAVAAGVSVEEYCFSFCQISTDWRDMMKRRGIEGAQAILGALVSGGNGIVGSHGGARIEVVIAALCGQDTLNSVLDNGPDVFVKPGQIVELIIDVESKQLIEVSYIDLVNVDPNDLKL